MHRAPPHPPLPAPSATCCSPFLEPFLQAQALRLSCDFVLSADGGQISETQPSLSIGLRCVADF